MECNNTVIALPIATAPKDRPILTEKGILIWAGDYSDIGVWAHCDNNGFIFEVVDPTDLRYGCHTENPQVWCDLPTFDRGDISDA
jgi:hypothetical protein